ncbi:MAG TPA: GMC family oxidoreductase [Pyrinomonadaceae bacterium]|nr:GMC family oxidoreductase [Pyrinomonadaceae bacterium]
METEKTYDLIIIGTGAGGGTLLHALAPTGKKILVLERGGYLPQEKGNWESQTVFIDNKYKAHETWYDKNGKTFNPEIHYFVGGNTKLYGAALLRFLSKDFEEIRHHDGISPAWPITYHELEPYYAQAERLYHVHGERGIDPAEARASGPFPYPPLRHELRIQELYDDLRQLGYSPFPLPMGVMLDEDHPENSPCIRCGTCDGFPCLIHAKADTEVACVRPALDNPNVTLLTQTSVKRLETNPSGREITRVVAERNGETVEYSGSIVILSCGAINSAAVLLRSASDSHVNGLANSSDMVGRHYMCHNNSAFVAISQKPNPTVFQKTLALNDFYLGSNDWGFPLGHIQTMGKADAKKFGAASPFPAPHIALDQLAKHSLDFWVTSEDLPRAENRVVVGRDGVIGLHYTENNLEAHDRLNSKLKQLLRKVDRKHSLTSLTICLRKKIPLRGTTHQCGTIRFGHDPKSSVLDVNCKAHDLDNLYVVDGSFFPSSAAMNPALTIMANALRVADHLKERLQ